MGRVKKIGVFIFVYILGILTFYIYDFTYFELSKEVKIVEVISIITTIFIGGYLASKIEDDANTMRVQKEMYILKINEIEDMFLKLEVILQSDEEELKITDINHILQKIRLSRTSFFDNLQKAFPKSKNTINKCVFDNHLAELRDLLTKTPINADPDENIVIKNNIVRYSASRNDLIFFKVNKIRNTTFEIKAAINIL